MKEYERELFILAYSFGGLESMTMRIWTVEKTGIVLEPMLKANIWEHMGQ